MTVFAAPQGMALFSGLSEFHIISAEAETQHGSSNIRAKNILIVINANVTGGCQDVARLSLRCSE